MFGAKQYKCASCSMSVSHTRTSSFLVMNYLDLTRLVDSEFALCFNIYVSGFFYYYYYLFFSF